jgi:hypothetical protein
MSHPGTCDEELVAADPVKVPRMRTELSLVSGLHGDARSQRRGAGAAFRCLLHDPVAARKKSGHDDYKERTMFSVVICRARHVTIAVGLMVTFLGNASASPNTITVQGGRPVAEAIQELNKRYGWQITYEDPPNIHFSDLTDVTDTPWPGAPLQSQSQLQSVQQTLVEEPGPHPRGSVPKGGSLSFTLPPGDPDELGAVEALVKCYNASRGGNVFAVVRGAGLLHVVPRQITGLSGNLEPVKPVLDTVITIEPWERTADALINEICKKVSIAANTHVGTGNVPMNMLSQTKTSMGESGKTARSILEQWILESGAPLSWQLLYGPDDKRYALNISWVNPVAKKQ